MPRQLEDLTYTVPEAALAVGVSTDTMRILTRRGDVPALRIGRRVLISRVALAEWMKANSKAAIPSRPRRKNEQRGAA